MSPAPTYVPGRRFYVSLAAFAPINRQALHSKIPFCIPLREASSFRAFSFCGVDQPLDVAVGAIEVAACRQPNLIDHVAHPFLANIARELHPEIGLKSRGDGVDAELAPLP